jgi:hypothetical protein
MFDSIADLNAKLAATGYFIDPVMIQVVFSLRSFRNPFSSKGQQAAERRNWSSRSPRQRART